MAKIETWRQVEGAESRCRLDEGFVFSCEFSYPRRQAWPRNLSETISAAYGLERRSLRVLTAETEFYFTRFHAEPHWLLEDVTWRSNPRSWTRAALAPPPATGPRFGFAFRLPADLPTELPTELDDDVLSLGGVEPGFVVDAAERRLRMDFAPLRAPYRVCDRQACVVQEPIAEEVVNQFKRGNIAKMSMAAPPSRIIPVEISLSGFTAAYNAL